MILIFGSLLGFLSIAFGAYIEHGLRDVVSVSQFEMLKTAIHYQHAHAVVIVMIGFARLYSKGLNQIKGLGLSAGLFIIGTLLFSFSIYVSIIGHWPGILNLTPAGGVTLMMAWLSLIYVGCRASIKSSE